MEESFSSGKKEKIITAKFDKKEGGEWFLVQI